jgi:hypothetical protein
MDIIKKFSYNKLYDGQDFVSLAHFIYLQPHTSVRPISQGYADGFLIPSSNSLYIWMPTPPNSDAEQLNYIKQSRRKIDKLILGQYSNLILDLRNNIGGIFFTFYNVLLPFLRLKVSATEHQTLMYGLDGNGELSNEFFENNGWIAIKFASGYVMKEEIYSLRAKSRDLASVTILVNERTMSSAEIMCILFQQNFSDVKVYTSNTISAGTGGLTNGCSLYKLDNAEVKVPVFTFVAGSVANNAEKKNMRNYTGGIPAQPMPADLILRK